MMMFARFSLWGWLFSGSCVKPGGFEDYYLQREEVKIEALNRMAGSVSEVSELFLLNGKAVWVATDYRGTVLATCTDCPNGGVWVLTQGAAGVMGGE